jgi:beta-phosphoglucomutase-like phosphatase (HAD superfamily)
MPLSLEQYASWLDRRTDLAWPVVPPPEPPKAEPHLKRLRGVRAVLWNVYGTLLSIPLGELVFDHPTPFVMTMALEKTISEFKMWASMSRKPGQPSEYMGHLYRTSLDEQRMAPSPGEKNPEIAAERVWEGVLKKLFAKDYAFDAGFYGSLNEYSKKIAYFFHASLQGTAAYAGAAHALRAVADNGLIQGFCADGQCFTMLQLQRGLDALESGVRLDDLAPEPLRVLSHAVHSRKPSPRLFQQALDRFAERGFEPSEILHIGSRLNRDLAPAKKLGMRTALFAGDRESLDAPKHQVNQKALKPNVLLTELEQIAEVVDSG